MSVSMCVCECDVNCFATAKARRATINFISGAVKRGENLTGNCGKCNFCAKHANLNDAHGSAPRD